MPVEEGDAIDNTCETIASSYPPTSALQSDWSSECIYYIHRYPMAAPPKAIDSEAARLAEAREALKSKHFDRETCVVSDHRSMV